MYVGVYVCVCVWGVVEGGQCGLRNSTDRSMVLLAHWNIHMYGQARKLLGCFGKTKSKPSSIDSNLLEILIVDKK